MYSRSFVFAVLWKIIEKRRGNKRRQDSVTRKAGKYGKPPGVFSHSRRHDKKKWKMPPPPFSVTGSFTFSPPSVAGVIYPRGSSTCRGGANCIFMERWGRENSVGFRCRASSKRVFHGPTCGGDRNISDVGAVYKVGTNGWFDALIFLRDCACIIVRQVSLV